MSKTYKEVVAAAGNLWSGSALDELTDVNPEYFRGQVETIADAFGREQDIVREDILDSAGIYRPLQWDGVRIPIIESATDPWVQDADGEVFDFGGEAVRELSSGVLVYSTSVMRDDNADVNHTDLHAAQIAAELVTKVTGREHTVHFHGTY